MQVLDTPLAGVKLIHPHRFGDDRGWFSEVFNRQLFESKSLPANFVQDNQSCSSQGVLRGLHYQLGRPQGKLVRCLSGHIWDVAVDLRRTSPDFGRSTAVHLKPLDDQGQLAMLWIPEGFGHGFLVLSETAEVLYKTTDYYHPAGERCIRWDDPTLKIDWPLELLPEGLQPKISAKDAAGASFADAELPETVHSEWVTG